MPKSAFFNLRTDKQQRLLECAINIFLEKQYELITVRDLLQCMGVSTGSFYNYFTDKDDLYFHLMDSIYMKLGRMGYNTAESIVQVREHRYTDCLDERELGILNLYYFLPDDVIKKYVLRDEGATFGNQHIENSFLELQRRGVIRKDIDLDLTIYFYKAISFIGVMYFRKQKSTDLEELRKINRALYYDLFTKGIFQRESDMKKERSREESF